MRTLILLLFSSLIYFQISGCASKPSTLEDDPQNLEAQPIGIKKEKMLPPHTGDAEATELNHKNNKDQLKPLESKNIEYGKLTKLGEAIAQNDEIKIKNIAYEMLTVNPKDIAALNALGLLYYQKGNYEASLYLFNKAVNAQPHNADVYNNIGLAKMALNEPRQAIIAFRKGLEINPNHVNLATNLGSIYIKNYDYVKAEIVMEKAVLSGSNNIALLNNFSLVLIAKNDFEKAANILEKLAKDNSNNSIIMLNYASVLIEHQKKYQQGLDVLNRLKFVGAPSEFRNYTKELESEAKAGLK